MRAGTGQGERPAGSGPARFPDGACADGSQAQAGRRESLRPWGFLGSWLGLCPQRTVRSFICKTFFFFLKWETA